MQLPIYRPVKYLSHTGMEEWKRCQYLFYLKRMSQFDYPSYEQGKAAAVGSAFDAFVKNHLAERMGLNDPDYDLDKLLSESVERKDEDIIPFGKRLFQYYVDWGFATRLFNRGISDLSFRSEKDFNISGSTIPFVGYPDLRLSDGSLVDFKVNGAFSVRGASVSPGYRRRWIDGNQDFGGPHPRFRSPLEQINITWARQMAVYSFFSFGEDVDEDIPVAIEQVSIRGDKVTIASIETTITSDFLEYVRQDIKTTWERVSEGRVDPPTYSKYKCNMYNQTCVVADKCEAYQKYANASGDWADIMRLACGWPSALSCEAGFVLRWHKPRGSAFIPVAQRIEQRTSNPQVASSNLARDVSGSGSPTVEAVDLKSIK